MHEDSAQGSDGHELTSPLDWRARIEARLANTRPRHAREDWLVPALSLQESRALQAYLPTAPIPAAVLVPVVERADELTVLLTQRASQLKNHAGQISFPGGRIEPEDAGPSAAALREAQEEIGLEARFVSVVGYLADHILMSGFRVTPVVAFVRPGFELLLDAEEVTDTFEVPLSYVFEPANQRFQRRSFGAGPGEMRVWDIQYQGRNIWGATAGMLFNLYRLCVSDDPATARELAGSRDE
jgi:8-oxo-dGTP pyrophosphatase MutT (NUDIX family)